MKEFAYWVWARLIVKTDGCEMIGFFNPEMKRFLFHEFQNRIGRDLLSVEFLIEAARCTAIKNWTLINTLR